VSAVATKPLLELDQVSVDYVLADRRVRAVDNVSLSIAQGEILGLAGESGCGKSTLAGAVLQILKPPAEVSGGRILFQGQDLVAMSREQLRRVRWRHVSLVFQSAMNVLNPVMRVGDQFVDMFKAHDRIRKSDALARPRSGLRHSPCSTSGAGLSAAGRHVLAQGTGQDPRGLSRCGQAHPAVRP